MFKILIISTLIGLATLFCPATVTRAQTTNPMPSLFPRPEDKREDFNGVRDMLKKLEIEKEKKDFDEMQERGKEALALASDLEDAVTKNSKFLKEDREKLETFEKLVRRIRSDLGGSDDDNDSLGIDESNARPTSVTDGFKILHSVTEKLAEELQKTTRFTVSAAAIQTSNAALRLSKLLKSFR